MFASTVPTATVAGSTAVATTDRLSREKFSK
jgi:hypothetical protein